MRNYRFGAVAVASDIELSGLAEIKADARSSITICRGKPDDDIVGWAECPGGTKDLVTSGARVSHWRCSRGEWYRVRYDYRDHFADFAIRSDGSHILVSNSPAKDDGEIANLIEGAILGRALRLAGTPLVHGNAVAADGRAIVLMGASGAGKSSLCWALVQEGCRLLSDDLAAIDDRGDSPEVLPARLRLRLWPDAAKQLAVEASASDTLFPTFADEVDKRGIRDLDNVEHTSAPLHAIYLMRRSTAIETPAIEPMRASEALAQLAANLHGQIDPGKEARQKELAMLARIAAVVPVRALTLPDDLGALSAHAKQLRVSLFA